jgi:Domain of unknown function (DUF4352)
MELKPSLRAFISAHPVFTGVGVVAGVGVIWTHWRTFLLLASLVTVLIGLVMLGMLAIDSWRRRREEKAAIAARADDQHEALLYGDDQWGVFGVRPVAEPGAQPFVTSGKAHRPSLVAGGAVVVGLLVFAVMATVNARSADPAARAPGLGYDRDVHGPASRSIPYPMNPTASQGLPSPVVPAPLPRPPSPQASAPVRMGQRAVDGNITFVVTSVDRSKTIANPSLPFMQTTAKGTFLTAQLTITNNGNQLQEFIASYQKLKINDAVYGADPAAAVWTLTFETFVSPGMTAVAAVSFDVPANTPPGGVLELHGSSRSPGANVELLPPQ